MSAADQQRAAVYPPHSIAERTDALLASTGVDGIILTTPSTMRLLAGVNLPLVLTFPDEGAKQGSGSATAYLVWGNAGRRTLIVSDYVEGYARQRTQLAIRLSSIPEPPHQVLIEHLRDSGLDEGLIGIEAEGMSVAQKDRITQALPGIRLVALDAELMELRAQKTESEIALIQRASSAIELGLIDAIERGSVGMTDRAFASSLADAIREHGADEVEWISLRWGKPDYTPSVEPAAIPPGGVVSLDVGCVVDGYYADMQRTFVAPPAPPDLLDTYARLVSVQRRAMLSLVPGARISDVYDRYTADMAKEGLEKGPWFLGHSIGVQPHEDFYLSTDEHREVLPGMVFAVEPEAWHAGMTVDIEDVVAIVDDRPKILSQAYADWSTMPQLGLPIKRRDDQS